MVLAVWLFEVKIDFWHFTMNNRLTIFKSKLVWTGVFSGGLLEVNEKYSDYALESIYL